VWAVEEGPVPVIVTEYPTVVVALVVVTVATASAGGVTVAGLTAHAGGEVVVWAEETWQVSATVPVKPLTVPIVILEEAVPPGASASGENEAACRVKSAWADADDTLIRAASMQNIERPASVARIFNLDFNDLNGDESDFNMSRFN
jgi:hypothetical protein